MLTELLKALEEKKSDLERDLAEKAGGEGVAESRDKERRLAAISEESIKAYTALWQSFTPPSPFPCPFCYVFDGKVSPLKPLPRVEDVEPVRCTVCGETFEIPIELLYA